MIERLSTVGDVKAIDDWVRGQQMGTVWQSLAWKTYQESLGRESRVYVSKTGERVESSALVIIDRTKGGFSTWDIPRGPIGNPDQPFLKRLIEDATEDRALSLFLSPPLTQDFASLPFRESKRHEQPSATRIIDLSQSEEHILAGMKPKGRYNISVAEKHGVSVSLSTNTEKFFGLLKKTSQRDKFSIHPLSHYRAFLENLPGSFLLLATLPPNPEPIAGLLGLVWEKTGIYYYGASSYPLRALMAPYALQWAAMRHCKAHGRTAYDLLGVAPPDAALDHPWQGVSGFKEKFGGTVVTYPPEQQIVLRPFASGLLSLKRKIFG